MDLTNGKDFQSCLGRAGARRRLEVWLEVQPLELNAGWCNSKGWEITN